MKRTKVKIRRVDQLDRIEGRLNRIAPDLINKVKSRKVSQLDRIEGWLNRIEPDLVNRLERAENVAQEATQKYNHLAQQLIGLLTKDQLEVATISGCPPEIYAIAWIELWKKKIIQEAPVPYSSPKSGPKSSSSPLPNWEWKQPSEK